MTGILAVVLAVVAYVVWTAQFLAAMKYTRWVASRLPDRWIQKRAKTYMWLLPSLLVVAAVLRVGLAMAVTLVVALMLYWNLLDRMRMQVRAIQARMPQRGHATKQA
jgi:hypothetical protein